MTKCSEAGCKKCGSYTLTIDGTKYTFCAPHGKLHGAEKPPRVTCELCDKVPSFGYHGGEAIRCESHAIGIAGLENVRNPAALGRKPGMPRVCKPRKKPFASAAQVAPIPNPIITAPVAAAAAPAPRAPAIMHDDYASDSEITDDAEPSEDIPMSDSDSGSDSDCAPAAPISACTAPIRAPVRISVLQARESIMKPAEIPRKPLTIIRRAPSDIKSSALELKPVASAAKPQAPEIPAADLQSGKRKYPTKRYCTECKQTVATFGKVGELPTHCSDCAFPGDVDVAHPKCAFKGGCAKQASYYKSGDPLGYCAPHKPSDEYKSRCNVCEFDGCDILASFGIDGSHKRQFCGEHKQPGMVVIGAQMCIGCGKVRASWTYEGSRHVVFCSGCAPPGTVTIDGRVCKYPGCKSRSTYGMIPLPGETGKVSRCAKHKLPGMDKIGAVTCGVDGCKKKPTFGLEGEPATRCKTHIEPGMKDVAHAPCEHAGCATRATFSVDGKYYCRAHKVANAKTLNPTCKYPGCKTRAQFGRLFQPPEWCPKHMTAEIKTRGGHYYSQDERYPKCSIVGCGENAVATVSATDHVPTFCESHAPDDARIIDDAQCANCHVVATIDRTSGLCAFCQFGTTHGPGAYHKLKEDRLHCVLCAMGIPPTVHDRQLDYASICGVRQRPDFYYECGSIAVIVECDERQHAYYTINANPEAPRHSYECTCEFSRMIAIHQTVGLPTIFVRYNPDRFTDARGEVVETPGNDTRDQRCAEYVRRLLNYLNRSPEGAYKLEGLYVIYLNYDGQMENIPEGYRVDYFDNILEPWSPC